MRLLILTLAACSQGSFSGTVDGAKPRVQSAFFVEEDQAVGLDGLILLTLTEVEDACAVYGDYYDDYEDAADIELLSQAWQTWLPESFWETSLRMRVSDPKTDLTGQVLEGMPWDQTIADTNQVDGEIIWYSKHLDADYFAGVTPAADYKDSWYSHEGSLAIEAHVPGESIEGKFITTASDILNGSPAGEVTIRFKAERCIEVERYIF